MTPVFLFLNGRQGKLIYFFLVESIFGIHQKIAHYKKEFKFISPTIVTMQCSVVISSDNISRQSMTGLYKFTLSHLNKIMLHCMKIRLY